MSINKPTSDDAPLTKSDLKEIAHELITEFKRDEKAESKEQQLARFRQQQRAYIESERQARDANQRGCDHRRSDGTSCVAWMQNSDSITRGVCMHCNKLFTPEMGPEYEQERLVSNLSPMQQAAQAALDSRSSK